MSSLSSLAKNGVEFTDWYTKAKKEINNICKKEGWNPGYFTDILSLTSPKVKVVRNIRIALHYMWTGDFLNAVMGNIKKSVENYEAKGIILGQKVYAFSQAIKGDTNAVVLDVWMARALGVEQTRFRNKKVNAECVDKISSLAADMGYSPRDTQAAIWAGIIKENGKKPVYLNVRDEYERLRKEYV